MELSYLYRPPPTENPFLRLQPNNQQPPTPPCPPVKNTFNPFRCQKSSTAEMETSTLPAHFLPPTTIPENPFLRRLPTPLSPPVRQTMNPFCCQKSSAPDNVFLQPSQPPTPGFNPFRPSPSPHHDNIFLQRPLPRQDNTNTNIFMRQRSHILTRNFPCDADVEMTSPPPPSRKRKMTFIYNRNVRRKLQF